MTSGASFAFLEGNDSTRMYVHFSNMFVLAEWACCPEISTKPPMYCLDCDPCALLFADYCILPPMFLKGCSCESRILVEGSEELILPAYRP